MNGFLVERSKERVIALLISALLAFILLVFGIIIAKIFFSKDAIAQFATAFSNPGFFGVPIIVSCFSTGAVFYIAMYIAFLNLLQWSYGVSVLKGEKQYLTLKQILGAPFVWAIVIGVFIFLSGIHIPDFIRVCMNHIANINTPLAMFVTGTYLAQVNVFEMFRKKKLYKMCTVRLLVIPVIAGLLISLVPNQYYELKMAILIAASCPVGSNVAVYAQLYDKDYTYAVETVVLSTLLAIITMPFIIGIATRIWL